MAKKTRFQTAFRLQQVHQEALALQQQLATSSFHIRSGPSKIAKVVTPKEIRRRMGKMRYQNRLKGRRLKQTLHLDEEQKTIVEDEPVEEHEQVDVVMESSVYETDDEEDRDAQEDMYKDDSFPEEEDHMVWKQEEIPKDRFESCVRLLECFFKLQALKKENEKAREQLAALLMQYDTLQSEKVRMQTMLDASRDSEKKGQQLVEESQKKNDELTKKLAEADKINQRFNNSTLISYESSSETGDTLTIVETHGSAAAQ